jgi:predicted alpha/beta hydrolase
VQFTFDRASRALAPRLAPGLPVWGMGHSMGALAQCLIASRYAVTRAGNVLMSACARARRANTAQHATHARLT